MRCVLHQIAQLSSSQLSSVQHDSTSFIKLEDITVPNIFIYDVVVRILEDNVCSVTQNMLSKYVIMWTQNQSLQAWLALLALTHSRSLAGWLTRCLPGWAASLARLQVGGVSLKDAVGGDHVGALVSDAMKVQRALYAVLLWTILYYTTLYNNPLPIQSPTHMHVY